MKNFNELLQCYIDKTASKEERDEFFMLFLSGEYDHLIGSDILEMLKAEQKPGSVDEKIFAEKIYNRIVSKHIEPAKIIPIHSVKSRWWMAAAAVISMALMATLWVLRKEASPKQMISKPEETFSLTVFKGKQFFYLPDGSKVTLNEGSELSYGKSFGVHSREVTLAGEAYFDVQHDPSKLFNVRTGKVTITVLGTAFNVSAYPERQKVMVTVTHGKVQVGDDQHTYGTITPNQQIAVNTVTNEFVRTNVNAETVMEWKSKYLIFDDVSMEEAATIIEGKYNVKVAFANDDIKKCRITATFLNGENLEQVLAVVSGVVQATYTIQSNGKVKIAGNGCK